MGISNCCSSFFQTVSPIRLYEVWKSSSTTKKIATLAAVIIAALVATAEASSKKIALSPLAATLGVVSIVAVTAYATAIILAVSFLTNR